MELQNKASILAELWITLRYRPEWGEFFRFNDVGLPLSFALEGALVTETTPLGTRLVEETFVMLCQLLGLPPEHTYYDLDDMFLLAGGDWLEYLYIDIPDGALDGGGEEESGHTNADTDD